MTAFRSGANGRLRPSLTLAPPILVLILSALVGCTNTAKPHIGPIEFVESAVSPVSVPAVTSVPTNGSIYLFATVTNDNQLLGVSWTVTCGSALPPSGGVISTTCGTFTPAQTASGPIPTYAFTGIIATYQAPSVIPKGGTVTITAHATSLPSITSSVTLTIVEQTKSAAAAGLENGPRGGA